MIARPSTPCCNFFSSTSVEVSGIGNRRIDLIEIGLRDTVRRHHVDGVAKRAQQQIPSAEKFEKPWTDAGEVTAVAHIEVQPRNSTGPAHVLEAPVGAERRERPFLHRGY